MCTSLLKEEEIFFGIIDKKGNRSSIVNRQPTLAELQTLWERYPELFSHECECGQKCYIYGHILKTRFRIASHSSVLLICPSCGKRIELSANFQMAQMRIGAINEMVK